jgi:penicillin-binding protein 1B
VRRAIERSLNAATLRLALAVGLPAIVDTARALGIHGELRPVPALALGSFEVTPLELARTYVPMANGGIRPGSPSAVRAVITPEGALEVAAEPAVKVISPAESYLMTSLLQGVVDSGTAATARTLGVTGQVAGKTGTTNDGRDAWFVGYSSRLLALVWVGFDSGDAHGLSGSEAAVPIWADFMRQALDAYPAPAFTVPAGIVTAQIDAGNGKLATAYCPVTRREIFIVGTEPPPCDEHTSVVDQAIHRARDIWQRLRDWWGR